jgi:predicted membrane-bound mannosyltransferase
MKKNVGSTDKVIRIILAIIGVVLFLTNVVSGTLGYIVLAIAAILVITSIISFCPLYVPFKINTGKKNS